MRLRLLQIL